MLGSFIVFLSVCALVAVYMSIVHRFLRDGETCDDSAEQGSVATGRSEFSGRAEEQWAH